MPQTGDYSFAFDPESDYEWYDKYKKEHKGSMSENPENHPSNTSTGPSLHFEAGAPVFGGYLAPSNASGGEISLDLEQAARYLLEQTTGLKSDDGHGDDTPARFVKMLRALTTPEPFNFTCFPNEEGNDEMVLQQDITFVSLCNHHVLPFIGKAHVAYIPGSKIVGLSKLARVVRHYAAGLQVQERLTSQIADRLEEELEPLGVAVVLQAEHTCMTIRGVKAPGSYTTTSKMTGVFADHDRTAKAELFQLISQGRGL